MIEGVQSSARPRVHVGLIDMGHVSHRAYCGLGFFIDAIPTVWKLKSASSTVLRGLYQVDHEAQRDIQDVCDRLREALPSTAYEATLLQVPKQHVGFGTKTTLLLGLIAAINRLSGSFLTAAQMQALSGRGGASGVGIHGFFRGGVIWDGGQPRIRQSILRPSGVQTPLEIPPMLARWNFPTTWRVGLVLCDEPGLSAHEEESFFEQNTPVPESETLRVMALAYHGLVPAFATADLHLLREVLSQFQAAGFKRCEVVGRSTVTQELLSRLTEQPLLAAGMSSVGPLLYVIFDESNESAATEFIVRTTQQVGARYFGNFCGWNEGCQIVEMRP